MADTLFSSAEAKAQLDSGVVAKLIKAVEASPLLTVTAKTGSVMGVQWRRVAEAADLGPGAITLFSPRIYLLFPQKNRLRHGRTW